MQRDFLEKTLIIILVSFFICSAYIIYNNYYIDYGRPSLKQRPVNEEYIWGSDGNEGSLVTTNFIIHYSTTTVSRDYVVHLAEYLENALSVYVSKMGFRKPISSEADGKIHVYIVDFKDNTLALTYFRSGPQWTIRKIEFDKDISLNKLRAVAAHELFHCIQATYNAMTNFGIEDWFLEGSAIGAEDEVYPDSNRYIYFANKWMQNPDLSLESRNYKYGCATLFWKYVWEFLGVDRIKNILISFSRMRNFTGVVNGFGGLDKFNKIFLDFAETNYFKERYSDGKLLYPIKLVSEFKIDENHINYTKIDGVNFYGQDYYVFKSTENTITINIKPYGEGIFGRIILLYMNGDIKRIDFTNISDNFSYTITNFNRYKKCILVISNYKYEERVGYRLSIYSFENLKISMPNGENAIYIDPRGTGIYNINIKNILNTTSEVYIRVEGEDCNVSLNINGEVRGKLKINPNSEVTVPLYVTAPPRLNMIGKIYVYLYSSKEGLLKGKLEISVITTGMIVDRVKYSELANVNTTIKVWVRLIYQFNKQPVAYGVVRELHTNQKAYTNESGWAVFSLSSSSIGSKVYTIYGVKDRKYNLTTSVRNATFTITWTCLKIIYAYSDKNTTLIGTPINVYARVVYAHNNEYLKGGIVMVREFNIYGKINSTGWVHFKLISNKYLNHINIIPLSDSYGYITKGIPFKLRIRWSGIDIKIIPSPSYIADIGSNISLTLKPVWVHNSSIAKNCIIFVNSTKYVLHNMDSIKLTYRRENISKIFLQIYCIKDNIRSRTRNITLLWTGFRVDMRAISKYNNIGEIVNVKVTVYYIHNNAPCRNARIVIDDKLKLTNENGTAVFSLSYISPGIRNISITSIRDQYGVSKIIEGNRHVNVIWTCISPAKINIYPQISYIGGEIYISGQLIYAHDGSPVKNTMIKILNKTTITDNKGFFNITYIPRRLGVFILRIYVIQNPYGIYKVRMNRIYNITIATEKIYEGLSEIRSAISQGYANNETVRGWSQAIKEISRGNISGAEKLIEKIMKNVMFNRKVMHRINLLNNRIERANSFGFYLIGWEVKEKVMIAKTLYKEGKYQEAIEVLDEAERLFRKTLTYSLLLISILTAATIVFVSSRIIMYKDIFD